MRRISIVGTSGAGKTTLARQLAARLSLTHLELDSLHWQADWTPTDTEALQARLLTALPDNAWVVDGNYKAVQPLLWERADTVVWLDYPLPVMINRLARRTARRVWTQEPLWDSGCREEWRSVFSRDSIFLWQWKTFRRNRVRYREAMRASENAHLNFVRFTSPHAAEQWLSQLSVEPT